MGVVIVNIWAMVLIGSVTGSYAQIPKSLNAMDTTLIMQSEVKGTGKPIILVGGGLTGWKSWEPFTDIFTSGSKKVIRLQLLAVQYGLENRPLPVNYSVKTESGAMAAALDSVGDDYPFDIVAWSYGALISLDFAFDHPEMIRTLTLIEPPAIWVLRETGKYDNEIQKTMDFFMTYKGDITEGMLADFLDHVGLVTPGQSARDLPQWEGWVRFRQSLRSVPYPVIHSDSIERIRKFQPPVLLVKGTGSARWLHDIIDMLAENLPHARIAEFPGGHAPHLVSAESFLTELERFQNGSSQ